MTEHGSPEIRQIDSAGIDRILAIADNSEFRYLVGSARAQAALSDLLPEDRRGDIDRIEWPHSARNLARNVTAIHTAVTTSLVDADGAHNVHDAARVAARAWEGLASLQTAANRPLARLNAATQYEIAGYQANAVCLARLAGRDRSFAANGGVGRLVALFLERKLLRLVSDAQEYTREPTDDAIAELLREIEERTQPIVETDVQDSKEVREDELLELLTGRALVASGLTFVSLYLLSGDEGNLGEARDALDLGQAMLAQAGAAHEAVLTANVRSLVGVVRDRSTWALVGDVHEDPRWSRYLRILARGLGSRLLEARSVSELWPSQSAAIQSGLLADRQTALVKMPTSAGKTRVAEMAIVDELIRNEKARCLYIAPYRSLAEEVQEGLDEVLGGLGFGATALLGGPEAMNIEGELAELDRVMVLTPEKADLLLRTRHPIIDEISLVVLDEGQILADGDRGVRFELLVTRLRRRSPGLRFLFLSAVVAQATLESFADWLGGSRDKLITSDFRPAVQRLAKLEWNARSGTGRLAFRRDSDESDLASYLPNLIRARTFSFVKPSTGKVNKRQFPDGTKAQLAAELAHELCNIGPVMIFTPQPDHAESVAGALVDRIDYAAFDPDAVGGQAPPRGLTGQPAPAAAVAREWLGSNHQVTRHLERGIGVHHGRLPEPVRTAIESDVRNGQITVLVATSTLAQGVNLPVRSVIFHSVSRFDETTGRQARITAREYWNIAGRAGRAGRETDGLVVQLVTNNHDQSDFDYYFRFRDDVEQIESALWPVLQQMLTARLSPEVQTEGDVTLDAGVLAMVVEEAIADKSRVEALGRRETTGVQASLSQALADTYVAVQARQRKIDLDPLLAPVVDRGVGLASRYTWEQMERYSRTGFAADSCAIIEADIAANEAALRDLLLATGYGAGDAVGATREALALLGLILEGVREVPEMRCRRAFDGDRFVLMEGWVTGSPMPTILDEVGGDTGREVARVSAFLEEFAGYRLPWGASSYLLLAHELLGIEEQGTLALALPGLIRFGVPTPLASWYMALGVSSRDVAQRLAARSRELIAAQSGELTFVSLLTWLADQPVERSAQALELDGLALAEFARICRRSRRHRLADQLATGYDLPMSSTIQLTDEEYLRVPEAVQRGTALSIVRDYQSTLDTEILQLTYRGATITDLPPDLSNLLAVEVDAGLRVEAVVESLSAPPNGVLTVEVRRKDGR